MVSVALFFLVPYGAYAQVNVTATGGTTGPSAYTSVKDAFDAINLGTHTGDITVIVTSGTTEPGTASLDASGTGSASYNSVLLKPDAGTTPTISGAFGNAPVIMLNGASNVMIDGSNNGTSSRDMTITNTDTYYPQVVLFGSVSSTAISGDTLKNCVIVNGSNISTPVIVSDGASPGSSGYFNNIGIVNNDIQTAYIGIYLAADQYTTDNGSGTCVTGNKLSNTGSSAVRYVGIYDEGLAGATISNNDIGNFDASDDEDDYGIWVAYGSSATKVSGNTISGLGYTGSNSGYAPSGIAVSPGITSADIQVAGNTISGLSSVSTGNTTGIYLFSSTGGVVIRRNMISDIKNSSATGAGAAGIWLESSRNRAAVNVYNNFVWDVAAYGTTRWSASGNGNGIVAEDGGGYHIYFNTVLLNTNQTVNTGTRAAAMYISSKVNTSNSIDLQNNLFINTQTRGNANSRMAFVIMASTSVLNSCDYNDYYAASGNLAAQGTNTTIWKTMANVQSNIGANSNSVSIQPTFASSTDLHLPASSNTSLNNTGISIASITHDIDNDLRTPTPDMGADEFGNCLDVIITSQPAADTVCEQSIASFSVAATNGTLVQWQVNTGAGFTNITNNATYSGATGNTLTVTGVSTTMSGYRYRARIRYSQYCRFTNSNAALLVVDPLPLTTTASLGSPSFCAGETDTLQGPSGTGLSYQWQSGGASITGETAVTYVATATGSYYLIVTNSVTGCSDSSAPIAINATSGPVAAISPSGTNAICFGSTITLSAGNVPGLSYQWQNNGTDLPGATSNTFITDSAGAYTVVVSTTVTCTNTATAVSVNVNPLPTATATAVSNAICQGSTATINANYGTTLTYQWIVGNSVVSGATSGTYKPGAAGSYRVVVTSAVTNCYDTSSPVAITVNPLPVADVSPKAPAAICDYDTSVLTANTGTKLSYQWLYNNLTIAGASGSDYRAFLGGDYSVEVTDSNGCIQTSAPVNLMVHTSPVATITYSRALQFCEGSAVSLNALQATGLSYQWYKNGSALTGVTADNYIVAQSGSYSVRVIDGFGCVDSSAAVPVTVFPAPVPVVTNTGGTLSTGSYLSYQWYFNNIAKGGADGASATYKPTENGAYKVVITDANGCTGTSAQTFIMNVGTGDLLHAGASVLTYPNPATDYLTVENKSTLHIKSLSLISSIGAVVYTREAHGTKERIDLAQLAAGLYYLRIGTEEGVLLKKVDVVR